MNYLFFFLCVCVIFLSISPLWTAAWVTFNEAGFNWSCFLLHILWNASCFNGRSIHILLNRFQDSFLGMLHALFLRPPSWRFSRFSLSFQFTFFESSLLFPALRVSDRVLFSNARPRVYVVVHRRSLVFSFPICSMKIASSWRRDSILRPSKRM